MEQLKDWFYGLESNDQKIVVWFGSFVFVMLLYLLLISPINSSVSKLETQVKAKQETVDWMKQQVPQILASKGGGNVRTSNQSLSSIVNTTTSRFSLAVSRRDSKSPNEMQIWFDNVSFNSFLSWSAELKKRYGISIATVNIRSQDRNGITSINVKLIK